MASAMVIVKTYEKARSKKDSCVESCRHPWRQPNPSLAYSSNPVQYLYINRYVTINKLVLSYLLLRLLPQW